MTALHDKAQGKVNPVVAVGVEVDDAGNLDDVVLYRQQAPHTYKQVKYTVDSRSPLDTSYLTSPSKNGGPSILRKVADAWVALTRDGAPVELALVTNRAPSPADQLLAGRDARTMLLMPAAAEQTRRSERGRLRATWAQATNLTEPQLLMLLNVLHFDTARDLRHLEETTSLLMLVHGLRGDHQAVRSGADWVAEQARYGHRKIDLEMIETAVRDQELRTGPARSVLSVATLKPDPLKTQAVHVLDWVDRFDGDDAFSRRRPRAPFTWQQLQADVEDIPHHLGAVPQVALTGSLRQAIAFLIGATLRMVTNVDLAVTQRGQLWESAADYDQVVHPILAEHSLGIGQDLALAVEVATPMTDDVLDFLRTQQVPVDRLVVLQPPRGAKDNAISTPAAAVALTVGLRDQARRSAKGHPRIHLFLAGPMGLALLLGHRWNRVAPTTVYEEIRHNVQYEPAFTINA
ncbi:SAVED domain-containing protein [Micromonospora aurantiaca (nom. illeg.)]|uniref:SAVED domain-containing protein n=1 Tax=Micromonospora aurantiaca (nom. illeg.) TaxID=47850 RepID=UPI003669B573